MIECPLSVDDVLTGCARQGRRTGFALRQVSEVQSAVVAVFVAWSRVNIIEHKQHYQCVSHAYLCLQEAERNGSGC